MDLGTKEDMASGLIKTVRLLRPLRVLSQPLRQSLSKVKSWSVLLLWLPALVNVSCKALLQLLRRVQQVLAQSLSSVHPHQLVDRLALQQALSAWLKDLPKFLRRLRQVLIQSLSQTHRQVLPLHHQFQSLAGLFKARVLQRQPFQRSPQTARSSGKKSRQPVIAGLANLLHRQHIQTSLRPAQAGNRRHEDLRNG